MMIIGGAFPHQQSPVTVAIPVYNALRIARNAQVTQHVLPVLPIM